jgi:hypothetical protein
MFAREEHDVSTGTLEATNAEESLSVCHRTDRNWVVAYTADRQWGPMRSAEKGALMPTLSEIIRATEREL